MPTTVYGHAGSPMRCHCRGGNNLRGAVQNSCNPYFYYVFRKFLYFNGEHNTFKASAIGLRQWHDMAEKFGMADRLGIDLPSERKGNLPTPEYYDKAYRRGVTLEIFERLLAKYWRRRIADQSAETG